MDEWAREYTLYSKRWRTGTKLGRTIYAMVGDTPSQEDIFIGIMDSSKMAGRIVMDHNNGLSER